MIKDEPKYRLLHSDFHYHVPHELELYSLYQNGNLGLSLICSNIPAILLSLQISLPLPYTSGGELNQ